MHVIVIIYFIRFCVGETFLGLQWTNYTLLEVVAYNIRERALLYKNHVQQRSGLVFFNKISNEAAIPMNILVHSCSCLPNFAGQLRRYHIEFSHVSTEALGRLAKNRITDDELDTTKAFLSWKAIEKWIGIRERKYSMIEKKVIGVTFEKRNLLLLKISKGRKKAAVLATAGEDGKDWTSGAIALNFINKLLQNKDLLKLLDYYELYFVPICNPDGYSLSIDSGTFWSRNRKTFFPSKRCSDGEDAIGVSIDRNWFLHQSTDDSSTQCNGVFIGHQTISEHETEAVSNVLNELAEKLLAFINIKGSGRMITIPYATSTKLSNNHDLMMEILPAVTDKVEAMYNVTYFYGTTADYLFNYTGNVADWVKNKLNVPVVYTVYLQHEDDMLPNATHIPELTNQFATIFNETLMLAKDIYGPLFNCHTTYSLHFANVFLIFFATLCKIDR